MKRHKNIICALCKPFFKRYKKLHQHIEEDHPREAIHGWVIKETSK